MKILRAEDDVDLLELAADALRDAGHTVLAATDGQQALACWAAEQPDLVLLDITLPILDGFEVCRRIRQEDRTPVILLTDEHEENIVRGLTPGADDCVTRPFSTRQLVARVRPVIRPGGGPPTESSTARRRDSGRASDRSRRRATSSAAETPSTRAM